jgi:hypothetical protein
MTGRDSASPHLFSVNGRDNCGISQGTRPPNVDNDCLGETVLGTHAILIPEKL